MRSNMLLTFMGSLLISHLPQGYAAQPDTRGSIDLGGFLFIPTVDIEQRYDDNLLRANANATSSWGTLISPAFVLQKNYGLNELELGYSLKRGDYYSSGSDDFTDHRLWTEFVYKVHSRHEISLVAEYLDGHDGRGTRYSVGRGEQLLNPDTYKNALLELIYSYGSDSSTGKIDLRYKYKSVNYDGQDIDYLQRDHDTHIIGSTFYYKLAPLTDLLLDVSTAQINYAFSVTPDIRLDSTEDKALVGIRWHSSAQTTGYAKAGIRRKDFDSQQREGFEGLAWEVGVQWQPLSYTHFSLATMSDIKETDDQGNFIEKRDYLMSWQHDWSARVNSELELLYQDDSYASNDAGTGLLAQDRDDRNWASKIATHYQFRRWLLFSVAYQYEQRDSSLNNLDFDRNLFSISMQGSL